MYFSCTLSKHTIHLFRESTRTIEASNGASLPSNRPTLCPFTAVSPHASQFSWVAPHTSHLPDMEQWHRCTMPCCCGPWLTISSPVMQNPSICQKSTKPLPPHRIYSLHTQCLGMATNNPLLFFEQAAALAHSLD